MPLAGPSQTNNQPNSVAIDMHDIQKGMSSFGVFRGKEKRRVHENGPLSHGDLDRSEEISVKSRGKFKRKAGTDRE
jgi:hypothetical protein